MTDVGITDYESYLRVAKYTLIKSTDMNSEMKEEAMDICITAVEKYQNDMEKCTQMIKEQMDKKFGSPWHVVVGKAFGYEITYEGIRELVYENTFITEPEGYGENAKFQRHKVQAVLKQVLKERMEKQKYDPVKGAQIAKQLADDLREKVKLLGYDRYKLIIQVTIGQKIGQAMRIVSRCLWDTTTDNFASEYFENESLYCVCQVYGLYYE